MLSSHARPRPTLRSWATGARIRGWELSAEGTGEALEARSRLLGRAVPLDVGERAPNPDSPMLPPPQGGPRGAS